MANHIAPQYRPLWAYLTEKYKQQQEKIQLNATREEQRQMKKKQKEETEEFHKLTRMTILMTEKTRKLASQVIQQLHNFRSVNKNFEPSGKCVDYVLKKGFTLDHIHQFKKYAEIHPADSEEDVERKFLETLLLHVPEEELPKEFIPSKGNFELLTTSISTQSPDIPLFEHSNDQAEETSNVTNQNKDLDFSFFKNSQPSDMKEIIEFIVSTFSFTNKQVYDFLNNYMHEFQFNESKEWVFALVKSLYDHYCKLHTPNKKIQKFDQSDADNQETLNEIIDEEKEVLKAIYDEQFIENEIKYKNEIIKYWKVPLNIEEINIHGELIVYFQGKGNKYPEEEPWLDIKVSSLSVENKQIIIQTLIYQYNSQEKEFTIPNHIQQPSSLLIHLKESQMISSILSWLEENTAKILETVNSIENGDEITSTPSETSTTDSFTSLSKELTFKKKEITKKKVKIFRKRKMTEKQIAEENEKLLKIENEKKNTEKGKQMEESRRRLPAHQFKEKIISEYLNSDILVISGETGCGKTTQIPQFILEYLLDNRMIAQSNMICTQPRRLSAIGSFFSPFFSPLYILLSLPLPFPSLPTFSNICLSLFFSLLLSSFFLLLVCSFFLPSSPFLSLSFLLALVFPPVSFPFPPCSFTCH